MHGQTKPRCLVWTGPRETDIQDCEENLFVGSVTLYGKYRDEERKFFCDGNTCSLIDTETIEAFETIAEIHSLESGGKRPKKKDPQTEDSKKLRLNRFNISFCESNFFYGKLRINHNAEDPLNDLFIVMEQVKLLAAETAQCPGSTGRTQTSGCEVYFMSYNPNFATRRGHDEAVRMLDDLIAKYDSLVSDNIEKPDSFNHNFGTWDFSSTGVRNHMEKPVSEHRDDLVYDWESKEEFRKGEFERIKTAYDILKERCKTVEGIAAFIGDRTVCINNKTPDLERLMADLDDKARFRQMCRMVGVPTTESITVIGTEEEASIASLKRRVGGNKFVVQRKKSSGGFGTYVFEDPSEIPGLSDDDLKERIDNTEESIRTAMGVGSPKSGEPPGSAQESEAATFVLSRYRDPNIPVNVHVVIGEHEILKSPYSIQVITNLDGKLIYSGADFIAFDNYAKENGSIVRKMDTYVDWMSKYLQGRQYRGVIGFDIIISGRNVEFVEANNRFQASTVLINRALRERKYLKDNEGRVKLRVDSNIVGKEMRERLREGYTDNDDPDFPDDRSPDNKNYNMVVFQDRKPSVQMLNLYAFPESVRADKGQLSLADEMYRRCYPNWKWRNVTNSRDSGNHRFPMTNPDFKTLNIPFSCYIYYNSSAEDPKGEQKVNAEHAVNMLRIINHMRTEDVYRMGDALVFSRLEICHDAAKLVSDNPADKNLKKLSDWFFKYRDCRNLYKTIEDMVPEDVDVKDDSEVYEQLRAVRNRCRILHIGPIQDILSKYAAECTGTGCFSVLSNRVNTINNIRKGTDYLINQINRIYDSETTSMVGGTILLGQNDKSAVFLKGVFILSGLTPGSNIRESLNDAIKQLNKTVDYCKKIVDDLLIQSKMDVNNALKEWDKSRESLKGYDQWTAFYHLVIDKSPVRDFVCSRFDHAGEYYGNLENMRAQRNAYLYKVMFRRNITSGTCGNIVIHPNIPPMSE